MRKRVIVAITALVVGVFMYGVNYINIGNKVYGTNYIELEHYDNMFNSKADCKIILNW